MNIELLDCTFRDGGYYTQWDFDTKLVEQYSYLIAKLPIKYIEIGYGNFEKKKYFGEFYYSPLKTIKRIKSKLNKSQKIVLMLDAKDYKVENITTLFSKYINDVTMVRIATKPDKIKHSQNLAKALKVLGFKTAINIMYISEINEEHTLYEDIGNMDTYVDYLYLVDSYGAIYPDELEKMIRLFQKKCNICLGFHGHNNLELAFINSLKAMECGVSILDSTVLGMGRGAGNLKLELLLTSLKAKYKFNVDLNSLSQLVELFTPLFDIYKWGTNLPYMVSGSYALPQKEVMEAIEINRYSIASMVNAMCTVTNDTLKPFVYNKKVDKCLIIGGGYSIEKHFDAILAYVQKNRNIIIIHSTSKYLDKFSIVKNRQLLCVAGDELSKLDDTHSFPHIELLIFEPSPRKISINIPLQDNMVELKEIDFIKHFKDSPLAIALQTALEMSIIRIELAGFDGYSELKSRKDLYLMHENQEIISMFLLKRKTLTSVTKTNYKGLYQTSIYAKVDE